MKDGNVKGGRERYGYRRARKKEEGEKMSEKHM